MNSLFYKEYEIAIGTLNEYTIHNQLKSIYAGKNDKTEQKLCGYFIDIVKKRCLIEIQTGNFLQIKPKLKKLLGTHKILLVHNIPQTKWLVKLDEKGDLISKRKSTKKGSVFYVFNELIYLLDIITDRNLSLEIIITEEEEIRTDDGKGSWRRKGVSIKDRKLISIVSKKKFSKVEDYLDILPEGMVEPFSSKSLAAELNISVVLSRKIIYFFKKIKAIRMTGKDGNMLLYKRIKRRQKSGS
jgi:hypothetical protein